MRGRRPSHLCSRLRVFPLLLPARLPGAAAGNCHLDRLRLSKPTLPWAPGSSTLSLADSGT